MQHAVYGVKVELIKRAGAIEFTVTERLIRRYRDIRQETSPFFGDIEGDNVGGRAAPEKFAVKLPDLFVIHEAKGYFAGGLGFFLLAGLKDCFF